MFIFVRSKLFLSLFLSLFSLCAVAQTAVPMFRPDSAHLGVALEVMPGRVLKIDPYERMWLHENKNVSVGLALNYRTRPEDADSFAADYNYPTFSVGPLWGNYHNVTMHKEAAPDWGQAVPVELAWLRVSTIGIIMSITNSWGVVGIFILVLDFALPIGFRRIGRCSWAWNFATTVMVRSIVPIRGKTQWDRV